MFRIALTAVAALMACAVLTACDSGGDASAYPDFPESGPEPVRTAEPIPAPGTDLDATQSQTGG